jgi:hypothetical protein
VINRSAASALFAFLLGSILGFLSLLLREVGWVLGGLLLTAVGAIVLYASRDRHAGA